MLTLKLPNPSRRNAVVKRHSLTLAHATLSYLPPAVSRYRWVVLARAYVIVTLGGFEAIHVGTGPYLPLGLATIAAGVAVGAYAFTRARRLKP